MDARWFEGHKDKEARRSQLAQYRPAFEELKEILEKHVKKKDACREYDSPGWANKQIAVNEWNAAIETLINLIRE